MYGQPSSSSTGLRWLGAQVWRASGRVGRNRRALYGGAHGLRIATFHGTPPPVLERVKRIVGWWRARWPIAAPEDVDALFSGAPSAGGDDRLLVTFDDGLGTNHAAAAWLASVGVRATFFVVPSLVDRTIGEFVRYHEERGATPFPPVPDPDARGLTKSQVKEMVAMGHRVAAHNFAHRDLGRLHERADLDYEIGNALLGVEELTGRRCEDFAIGFGQPENVSPAAAAYLLERRTRVYACHRGLNVPGLTPRFLLRHADEPDHPLAFARVCLLGGADHHLHDRAESMVRRVGTLPAVGGAAA